MKNLYTLIISILILSCSNKSNDQKVFTIVHMNDTHSKDKEFAEDLADQIKHHAKDFNVINSLDEGQIADIILIDEDEDILRQYHRL